MVKKIVCFFALMSSVFWLGLFCGRDHYCAITYVNNHGRLGDHVLLYMRTRMLSLRYKIPFFYEPFKYSDLFAFSKFSKTLSANDKEKFTKTIMLSDEEELKTNLKACHEPTLFVCKFTTTIEVSPEYFFQENGLRNILRKELKLARIVNCPVFPDDRILVAVHVRKGVGHDPALISKQYFENSNAFVEYVFSEPSGIHNIPPMMPPPQECFFTEKKYSDQRWPTKFPPEQFYVDQIKKLSELLGDPPLYMYVFTDDPAANSLVARLEKSVSKPNILFGVREGNHGSDTDILEDLHVMMCCDCLIRGSSGFARIAHIVGNHRLVFALAGIRWVTSDVLLADKVNIFIGSSKKNAVKEKIFQRLANFL